MSSDAAPTSRKGTKGVWTPEDNYALIGSVLRNLMNGKGLSIATVTVPGRTPKAISLQWPKLKAELGLSGAANGAANGADGAAENGTGGAKKERKAGDAAAPRATKKRATKAKKEVEEDEAENGDEDQLLSDQLGAIKEEATEKSVEQSVEQSDDDENYYG